MRRLRRRAGAVTLGLLAAVSPGRAQAPPAWQNAWDFMVASVCGDQADRLLPGVSPLDGPRACAHPRKLRIGERLPYHKRDWPGLGDRAHPDGYQQSDSFPVATGRTAAAVQTYDFGDPPRAFGRFDPGDGGQVVFFTSTTAAIGITEDGGAGRQLFLGPDCAPANSWVIVDRSFATAPAGETLARLTRRADLCPDRLGFAFTRWHVQPLAYRIRTDGRTGTTTLTTLVSEHFGGRDIAGADHLERMYFTRELGYTRWERWQNFGVHDRAADRRQAAAIAASERCAGELGAPAETGAWGLVDCREWTQIVPPVDPAGDLPTFWVDRLGKEGQGSALDPLRAEP